MSISPFDNAERLIEENKILKEIVHEYEGLLESWSDKHNIILSNAEAEKIQRLEARWIKHKSVGDLTFEPEF